MTQTSAGTSALMLISTTAANRNQPVRRNKIAEKRCVERDVLHHGRSYTVFYVVDADGDGEFAEEDDVRLVPTVHCRACGQRMMAGTTSAKPDHVIYRCPCGEVRLTKGNNS